MRRAVLSLLFVVCLLVMIGLGCGAPKSGSAEKAPAAEARPPAGGAQEQGAPLAEKPETSPVAPKEGAAGNGSQTGVQGETDKAEALKKETKDAFEAAKELLKENTEQLKTQFEELKKETQATIDAAKDLLGEKGEAARKRMAKELDALQKRLDKLKEDVAAGKGAAEGAKDALEKAEKSREAASELLDKAGSVTKEKWGEFEESMRKALDELKAAIENLTKDEKGSNDGKDGRKPSSEIVSEV